MSKSFLRALLPIASIVFLAACTGDQGDQGFTQNELFPEGTAGGDAGGDTAGAAGGDTGGDEPAPPAVPTPPEQGSYVLLVSGEGDFIGGGENFLYTLANANLSMSQEDGQVQGDGAFIGIDVAGDENWSGRFQIPAGTTQLAAGTYANLTRYPFHDEVVGGMDWSGEGRGCNTLAASMMIDSITFDGDTVTDIEMSFEQYCGDSSVPLQGQIRWDADDATTPPGAVTDIPTDLWEPSTENLPDTGNYVVLDPTGDDFITQGIGQLYTDATSTIDVDINDNDGAIRVAVDNPDPGDSWNGSFQGMDFEDRIEVGYYPDLMRYPFHTHVKGGLSWSGQGRGCNKLEGWFVVDAITWNGDDVTALELRFEQRCEGTDESVLHGAVRWAQ